MDRDARWLSSFYQALWRLMGQRQRMTLAYRPQGNAKNERAHCTWYQVVKMYGNTVDMDDWVESFRYLEFMLNTIWNGDKHEMAFYLLHGWDPMMPLEVILGRSSDKYEDTKSKSSRSWRRKRQRMVQTARRVAQQAMYERWEKQIKSYEKKVKGKAYKEGDRVWVYINKVPKDIPKKLAHRWHGPFRVQEVLKNGQYYKLHVNSDYS